MESGKSTAVPNKRTFKEWLRKYFNHVDEKDVEAKKLVKNLSPDERFVEKYRKIIAFAVPISIAQFLWWSTAIRFNYFALYATHWHMPLTMVFGGLVAGMTSEGGGAIAFPVMTFVLHMSPKDGRDFSVIMQALGMSTALFAIIFMRLKIEWRALAFGLFGSVPGNLVGFYYVDQLFTAAEKKMLFVSIWSSFAMALWLLNREQKRVHFAAIQELCLWKAAALCATGAVGGVFTALAGSGLDICLFSVTTLLFSVSEKNATPTTVVAMAASSLFCFYWRYVIMGDVSQVVLDYLKVSVPVGMALSAVGSFLGSFLHRQVLAHLIYLLEATALLGFLASGPPVHLLAWSGIILLGGFFFFSFLCRQGKRMIGEGEISNSLQNPLIISNSLQNPRIIHNTPRN